MKKFTAAIAGCSNYKPGANELDWGIAIMEGGGPHLAIRGHSTPFAKRLPTLHAVHELGLWAQRMHVVLGDNFELSVIVQRDECMNAMVGLKGDEVARSSAVERACPEDREPLRQMFAEVRPLICVRELRLVGAHADARMLHHAVGEARTVANLPTPYLRLDYNEDWVVAREVWVTRPSDWRLATSEWVASTSYPARRTEVQTIQLYGGGVVARYPDGKVEFWDKSGAPPVDCDAAKLFSLLWDKKSAACAVKDVSCL